MVEDHSRAGREAVTTIGAVDLSSGAVTTLAAGADFYSTPRLSPDGSRCVLVMVPAGWLQGGGGCLLESRAGGGRSGRVGRPTDKHRCLAPPSPAPLQAGLGAVAAPQHALG